MQHLRAPYPIATLVDGSNYWEKTMAMLGYLRVSTTDQDTGRQLAGLELDRTFTDHASGATADRPALQELRAYMRPGDIVHVHSLDRLARSLADLEKLVGEFMAAGVTLRFEAERLEFLPGTDDPFGALLRQILGAFAQFERSLIKSRQKEGIARAKAAGKYKGRQKTVSTMQITALRNAGHNLSEIAKILGVDRSTIYRNL